MVEPSRKVHELLQPMGSDRADFMATTTKKDFVASDGRKRTTKPSSAGRKNNPHGGNAFRTQQLPNGTFINVSLKTNSPRKPRTTNNPTNPGTIAGQTPVSSQRLDFASRQQESWQRGNVTRYGLNKEKWAGAHNPAVGMVPIMPTNEDGFRTTMSLTQEAYGSATDKFGGSTRRRNEAGVDSEVSRLVKRVMRSEFGPTMEAWLQAAPPFEAAAVKKMLAEVYRQQKNNRSPGHIKQKKPENLPSWAGP